jgi:uncharacterized OB-fold protein
MFWRMQGSKYRLKGTKCTGCKSTFFPPRILCPKCRTRENIEEFEFSGDGEIVSYTIIRSAPEGFEKYVPYAVAIIKLDEGSNISGQIVGNNLENIKAGARVRPVFRRMFEDGSSGLIQYGVKFEIVDK